MHLVTKRIKGSDYFYLLKKERRGKRVVTAKTVYIGNRQRLAELLELSAANAFPAEATVQEIGGSLALARVAADLGLERIIDAACPVRANATPIGRRLVLAAIHRALAPRGQNSLLSLQHGYATSSLAELLPAATAGLDNRRMCEALARRERRRARGCREGTGGALRSGVRLQQLRQLRGPAHQEPAAPPGA